ncbi:hypothetical protein NQ314_002169 [Rhamnusium bicolor]|uniref:Prokaryotic-type class I peptide chain release factors domain-containing protein n=1 Tax=Rhamnusium bicolor TaxID=1586634 RepID=A0AAV8ZQ59_9CUCU|nr:hypothetical protein NQ314_002169 [Rhamnusium bicolor]
MRFLKSALNITTFIRKYNKNQIDKYWISVNNLCYKEYGTCPDYNVDLKIPEISLNNYFKNLEKEYEELCKRSNYASESRWIELHPIVQIYRDRQVLVENIYKLKELLQDNDDEIRQLAEEEKYQFESKIKETDQKLLDALLPDNNEDSCDSLVLEVQAGVGGQEAMLFAKEVFDMYCNFAQYKGWDVQIADYLTTDIGGIRHATALIDGNSVFRYFKHEAGIHRVQRTPSTEKSGRIHTSTVSVVALPQPTDIEVNISPKDLKIETKRSTGAGGQHVNTTDSAVRIVHLPTGIAVECQVDRSQIKNRKFAMARLTALLYQRELDNQNQKTEMVRKSQVRTRNRNEKIRTYNYNQDRITDHRIQGANIHNLKVFLDGGEQLDNLIKKLDEQDKLDNLLNIIKDNKLNI